MGEKLEAERRPLSAATKVAIVALWFHVVLSCVLLLGALGAGSGEGVFLALLSGAVWAPIAVGLARRAVGAWWAGVSISGILYVYGLFHGRVISTLLLILIPLLLARPGDPAPRYSIPPTAEEPDPKPRRLPLGWPYMSDHWD